MIGLFARALRGLVIVAVVVGAVNHFLGVPVEVALGYCLVGWYLMLLRRPIRWMARRRPGGARRR
ncbi:hypothetical protein AB0876_31555 [Mycobacterium sp. NPDC049093]